MALLYAVTPSRSGPFLAREENLALDFRTRFNQESFQFEHRLAADPRFHQDALRELAFRMPPRDYQVGKPSTRVQRVQTPRIGTFSDAFEQLQESDSWIVLKNIHRDQAYAPILRDCMRAVQKFTPGDLDAQIRTRSMSLILTSPDRVTPYHIEGSVNFLFQLQGRQTLFVCDGTDRSILTEPELEQHWMGNTRAATMKLENHAKAEEYWLTPGEGVHIPLVFPHWARTGREVSMQLSISFEFAESRYDGWRGNHVLRKLGFRPGPVDKPGRGLSRRLGQAARIACGAFRWSKNPR